MVKVLTYIPNRAPLALGLVLLAISGQVRLHAAVALNGTFGFTPVGSITYSGPDLGQADSISLPATEIVNTVPANYNGSLNDFYSGPAAIPLLSHVNLGALTLSLPAQSGTYTPVNYPNFLVISDQTNPADRFDFTLIELMRASSSSSDLEVYAQGILHDSSGVFSDTSGLLSITFTQAGPGAAVNASFSVASTAVPEAGTIASGCVALGVSILGFAGVARNKLRLRGSR
ncbi:MAG TPA: hypothetical protein VKY92_24460 [Verrucomicrobiae bacterium]|nr:hypothetical protein [Verrucomicrobiae bacterium]